MEGYYIKTKLKIGKYGASCIFLTDNKLLIIGGSNSLSGNYTTQSNSCELYPITGFKYDEDYGQHITLSPTLTDHVYGGICKGLSYNDSNLCIGSNYFVELYDGNKDYWQFVGKETNFNHVYSSIWCNQYDKNILFISSPNNTMEWIDVRMQNKKWNIYNQNLFRLNRWRNNILCI